MAPPDAAAKKHLPGSSPREGLSVGAESARVPLPGATSGAIGVMSAAPEPTPTKIVPSVIAAAHHDAGTGEGAAPQSAESTEVLAAKNVTHEPGIPEILRDENGGSGVSTIMYLVEAGGESDFRKIIDRRERQWNPWSSMLFPAVQEAYGTTQELFTRIKRVIGEQAAVSGEVSALLTFWAFSTWFREAVSLAPCLVITGWAHEGELILRTLRTFCYHPVLLAGITSANLNLAPFDLAPTLLISEPNLGKRMALLLDCSTSRGYQTIRDGDRFDYFGPKAIYLGEDLPKRSMTHSVHINASQTPKVKSHPAPRVTEEMAQCFQNQLFNYRVKNLQRVFKSNFTASGLPSEANAVANALGNCIVDAPKLQAELVSLLMPQARQQITERLDDFATVVVGAALSLCHQDRDTILVGEIAAEVNRIFLSRGERLQFSAAKVGHKLKKVGLLTRRLGGTGNGYLLDHATQVLLHEVGAAYGCEGLVEEEKNLHCTLCKHSK